MLIIALSSCKKSSDTSDVPVVNTPGVTTSAITNITASSAYCGGAITAIGSSPVTICGICIGTMKNPSISDFHVSITPGSGPGSFTISIGPLVSSTVYHVRAFATNSYGTSYGADISFTTLQGVLPEGYYIQGGGTGYPNADEKTRMKITKNEHTGYDRSYLLELYIPVKAGAAGFNIVQVEGSTRDVIGPGTGFATITNGTIDEPKVPFQRGPVIATTTPFTVPSDGLYHVVFDYQLNIGVVSPVHFGMIGAAVPSGWVISTDMIESAFNPGSTSWSIDNLTMHTGEWKFRYCNGWRIILDTVIDNGQGSKGVSVNTNLGGTIDALIAGGYNLMNSDPGIYSCLLGYTVGSGFSAGLTKTGNNPETKK